MLSPLPLSAVRRKILTTEQLQYFCSELWGLLVVLLVFPVKLIPCDSSVLCESWNCHRDGKLGCGCSESTTGELGNHILPWLSTPRLWGWVMIFLCPTDHGCMTSAARNLGIVVLFKCGRFEVLFRFCWCKGEIPFWAHWGTEVLFWTEINELSSGQGGRGWKRVLELGKSAPDHKPKIFGLPATAKAVPVQAALC